MEHIQEKQPPDVITSDTENQTIIPVDKAQPEKQEKFRRFRAYNTGLWNGPRRENKKAVHRQDDLHLYDSIASQVCLTQYQKARGRRLLDSISVDSYTTQNGGDRPTKSVIFAICIAVANDDVPKGTRYWPHPDTKSNDHDFERVAESIPTEWPDLVSLVMMMDELLSD